MSWRLYKRGRKFYADISIGSTYRRRIPAFENQRAAEGFAKHCDRLAQLVAAGEKPDADAMRWIESLTADVQERLAKAGLIEPERAAAARDLEAHLAEYEADMRAKGRDERHVDQTIAAVKATRAALRWRHLADIDATRFAKHMQDLAADGHTVKGETVPYAPRTINSRLVAFKGFLTWLVRRGILHTNPLATVSKLGELGEESIERRALCEEDFGRLLAAADNGPNFRNLTGAEWGLLFRIAAVTGLRWSELKSLRRESFDLEGGEPTVTILAKNAKGKKTSCLPLRADVAARMADYFANHPALPTAQAFILPAGEGTGAKAVRFYLALTGDEAGDLKPIPFEDEAERRFDFHALRGMFATALCRANVPLAAARELMRHSTVDLTAKHYTRLSLADKRGAVEAISLPSGQALRVVKTGTAGAEICANSCANNPQFGRISPNQGELSGLRKAAGAESDFSGEYNGKPLAGMYQQGVGSLAAPQGFEPRLADPESATHNPQPTDETSVAGLAPGTCANSCAKPEPETHAHLTPDGDLARALAMLERLPLTDDEKANAVRRMLNG